jgi:hypothetical protein
MTYESDSQDKEEKIERLFIIAHRADRVQFSPPQSAPTQPSTFSVSGPDIETLLA